MRLSREIPAAIVLLSIAGFTCFYYWWASGRARSAEILGGVIIGNAAFPASRYFPPRLFLTVRTDQNQTIVLKGDSWDFVDCDVGDKVKYRRTETDTGYVRVTIVRGSCIQ